MNQPETKIYIHSQSDNSPTNNNQFVSLEFEGHKEEQAYSTRALNLWIYDFAKGKSSIFVIDTPIPEDYLAVLTNLGFNLPMEQLILTEGNGNSLTKKVVDQKEIILKKINHLATTELSLSVFTPTQNEIDLATTLESANVNPEFSIETFAIANKGGAHLVLEAGVTVNGESLKVRHGSELLYAAKFETLEITSAEDLSEYLHGKYRDKKLYFKHPHSTGGEGLWSNDNLNLVFDLIKKNNLIVVEAAFENSTEHSLHFRIDPITKAFSFIATYDQTVVSNGNSGFSHSGCRLPCIDFGKQKFLEMMAEPIAEQLINFGATGDMCLDVLVRKNDEGFEMHIMEINPRTGANLYALRLAQAVMKTKFQSDENPNFELMAGLKLGAKSITELFGKYPELEQMAKNGEVIFSNYGRFAFGSWDVIFLSPNSLQEVDQIKNRFMAMTAEES